MPTSGCTGTSFVLTVGSGSWSCLSLVSIGTSWLGCAASGMEKVWWTKKVTASSTVCGFSKGRIAPTSAHTRKTASVDIFLRRAAPRTSAKTSSSDRVKSSRNLRRSAFAAILLQCLVGRTNLLCV